MLGERGESEGGNNGGRQRDGGFEAEGRMGALSFRWGVLMLPDELWLCNRGSLISWLGPVLVLRCGGEDQLASELREEEEGAAWVSGCGTGEGILEYCPRRRRL
jgi:hypothetical protein